jgi:Na+/melibiose symporter-like transporter
MSAALLEIPEERSGVASALLQTVVKLGPAFGASILGSILTATYRTRVSVEGLPADAAAAAQASVFGALQVARQIGSPALAASAQAAFVAGIDDALRVTAAISVVAIVLALLFLPARSRAAAPTEESLPARSGTTPVTVK